MKKLFPLGLLLLLPGLALAQHRPKPKAKKKPRTAVAAKTAAPAKAAAPYFQQEVNYTIDVKLDDRAHYLRGREELTYTQQLAAGAGFYLVSPVAQRLPRQHDGFRAAEITRREQ